MGLEECVRLNSQSQETAAATDVGWTRVDLPMMLVITDGVRVKRLQAKRFNPIFDCPSDRVLRHDWPSSRWIEQDHSPNPIESPRE